MIDKLLEGLRKWNSLAKLLWLFTWLDKQTTQRAQVEFWSDDIILSISI